MIYANTVLSAVMAMSMWSASLGSGNDVVTHDDIVDVASGSDTFSILVSAVKAADLVETLKSDGPFTVFAPTNAAFEALPAGTLEDLLRPENKDRLQAILTFHVVAGRVEASDILAAGSATTVNGKALPIGLRVGEANIIKPDIEASNGIIHVIDRVLLPSELMTRMTPARLIEMAISRGAPLYNHGQPAACAAVYEVAAEALMMDSRVPKRARASLDTALRSMRSAHGADSQAWIMRRGLDEAYEMMTASASDH